jgi:hypothetical protein
MGTKLFLTRLRGFSRMESVSIRFFVFDSCLFVFIRGKNKNPTAVMAVGFTNSSNAIRTRPPRGTAARLAAGSDSSCDSRAGNYAGLVFTSNVILE